MDNQKVEVVKSRHVQPASIRSCPERTARRTENCHYRPSSLTFDHVEQGRKTHRCLKASRLDSYYVQDFGRGECHRPLSTFKVAKNVLESNGLGSILRELPKRGHLSGILWIPCDSVLTS